ncbi:MAG: hypothetical protein IJ892_04460 [Prevotella sp.]|nr:hypothetical protein [Prevotella sp.]
MVAALLTAACHYDAKKVKTLPQPVRDSDDATIYALVCDGTNDSILVYLNDPYDGSDPDTLSILEAYKAHRVFGSLRVGDRMAMLRDTTDTSRVSMVVVTQDLLGQWCQKMLPKLRRKAGMEGMSEEALLAMQPDSIRQLLKQEKEYGFSLKIDSAALPIGFRLNISSEDEDNPLVYDRVKLYRQWCINNGKLLLTEAFTDSLGNQQALATDTAELVLLTPDSLVLRIDSVEQGFYRKHDNGE